MEPETKDESQGSVIFCESMEGISLPVEPKVLFHEAIKFFRHGEKVGSADVIVDMKNVPGSLHGIALAAIQCCVGQSFYLDALTTEPAKPPALKESWWDKVKKKWKIKDCP